jgi:hypothetical protein
MTTRQRGRRLKFFCSNHQPPQGFCILLSEQYRAELLQCPVGPRKEWVAGNERVIPRMRLAGKRVVREHERKIYSSQMTYKLTYAAGIQPRSAEARIAPKRRRSPRSQRDARVGRFPSTLAEGRHTPV